MASSTAAGAGVADARRGLAALVPPRQGVPATFLALTIASQIAYPLTSGTARDRLTVATVLLWTAASLSHATATRGRRFAAGLLAATSGIGFAAEAIGVATGFPFGTYSYADSLGPRLAGVPLIIPFAWTMMAYPSLLTGRRIGSPVLGGALALASWDLFLDPQMVTAGHWSFSGAGPRLNGIPVSNTVGWVAISLALMAILSRIPERTRGFGHRHDDRLAYAMYLWTYASGVLAAAAFFHRPGVALVGGLVMGVPAALLARTLRRSKALAATGHSL